MEDLTALADPFVNIVLLSASPWIASSGQVIKSPGKGGAASRSAAGERVRTPAQHPLAGWRTWTRFRDGEALGTTRICWLRSLGDPLEDRPGGVEGARTLIAAAL